MTPFQLTSRFRYPETQHDVVLSLTYNPALIGPFSVSVRYGASSVPASTYTSHSEAIANGRYYELRDYFLGQGAELVR